MHGCVPLIISNRLQPPFHQARKSYQVVLGNAWASIWTGPTSHSSCAKMPSRSCWETR